MSNWLQESDDWQFLHPLVERFDNMLRSNNHEFFDVEEFEQIIDYYMSLTNYGKSETAIRLAMKQHPGSNVFLLKRAQLFSSSEKAQQALSILKRIELIEPENIEIITTKAYSYSKLGDHKQAISEYRKALKLSDSPDEIHINIASELNMIDNTSKALEHLKKALEINPQNETALVEIFLTCDLAGELPKACEIVLNFLDSNPFSLMGWFNLGNIYNGLKQYENAIDAFDYTIAIDPDYTLAYLSKGETFTVIEKHKDALETYKEMISMGYTDPWTYNLIGECYERMNITGKSQKYFLKSIEIDPYISVTWVNLGISCLDDDKPDEALKYAVKALTYLPEDPDIIYVYAETLAALGRFKESYAAYEKVLSMSPDNADIWIDYADAVEEEKGNDQALKILERGLEILPQDPALQYRYAACQIMAGKEKQAMLTLFNAMSIDISKQDLFFDYLPEMKSNADIIRLLELFKGNI